MIGIIPNSEDLSHPKDRRRYLYYLLENEIPFEIADLKKDYNVLLVPINTDLNQCINYKKQQLSKKKNVRIILDLTDFYLADSYFRDKLRSLYYYLSGRTKTLQYSFVNTIIKLIKVSDVLMCASKEQFDILQSFHSNIVIVRDYFEKDILKFKKSYQLSSKDEVNILWEGLSSGNLKIFKLLRKILENFSHFKINLFFLTDTKYCKIGGKYFCQPTENILKKVFYGTNIKVIIKQWNNQNFSKYASYCDLALIPIPNDPIMELKPENKLILLWSIGIPTITSDLLSYKRVMDEIKQDYYCSSIEDWHNKLKKLLYSQKTRLDYINAATKYIKKNSSKEVIFKQWDKIFFNKK